MKQWQSFVSNVWRRTWAWKKTARTHTTDMRRVVKAVLRGYIWARCAAPSREDNLLSECFATMFLRVYFFRCANDTTPTSFSNNIRLLPIRQPLHHIAKHFIKIANLLYTIFWELLNIKSFTLTIKICGALNKMCGMLNKM